MLSNKLKLIAFVALISNVTSMSINTPKNVERCKNVTLEFEGGKAPYSIEVTNGTEADFPEIVVEIKDIEESPYNYTVNGTQEKIGFILHSDDEKTAYTGNVKIAENNSVDDDGEC
ncbi:hypothetical protein E3P92_00494 [Wallemia ichthyophaga]|uniref:Uncharacterized protein n=2 Tax=Wallemia ichthyophaga TaxID=245174 RepID=A0A4T0I8K0_WALIC|nr:hypothetical protein E3P91_01591 [Wallemia ichthyophaga]TIA82178.1 hypothetical protein E3P98_01599 [Wallemia ichthyophaga]TIA94236.1 hypothetical protein E3P97_00235 [Wallemia ichthyophaga]TIB03489.1 hypothetical protein E3P95_00570 [Wallemia ichthyophaga]TIB03700.1 hypothetical protein E3P96_01802 [Wallemia ichthyophaga]